MNNGFAAEQPCNIMSQHFELCVWTWGGQGESSDYISQIHVGSLADGARPVLPLWRNGVCAFQIKTGIII